MESKRKTIENFPIEHSSLFTHFKRKIELIHFHFNLLHIFKLKREFSFHIISLMAL